MLFVLRKINKYQENVKRKVGGCPLNFSMWETPKTSLFLKDARDFNKMDRLANRPQSVRAKF